MPGYREFMPGQVWFYYNANATKELERKKELGSITSRPVVIIQDAFYPEWNDVVTVCPMTSSDRRSGVFVDSTLLKDGSLIEGGTVLPYLIYTIKTKYLFPVMGMNHKRKLISLAPETFEQVKKGVWYHLGITNDPPEYVKEWKHVSDYDREIIIRDVRLAVKISEDMTADGIRSHNPILAQTPSKEPDLENHIIASLDRFDRDSGTLYSSAGCEFTEEPLGTEPAPVKQAKKETCFQFTTVTPETFALALEVETGECFPTAAQYHIGPESEVLKGVELKNMEGELSLPDQLLLCSMTMSEIMANTGIASSSTASRLRRQLREKFVKSGAITVEDTVVHYNQDDAPEHFHFTQLLAPNKASYRRAARRRKVLFARPKEELLNLVTSQPAEIIANTGLPGSSVKPFIADICALYPMEHVHDVALKDYQPELERGLTTGTQASLCKDKYLLIETLSSQEIHEIRSCSKRNMSQTAKNYGVSKERFRALHDALLAGKGKEIPYAMDDEKALACKRVVESNLNAMTPYQLLVFCRCDYPFIAEQYNNYRSANTPSKQEIRKLKIRIRNLIVSDMRQRRR